MVLAGGAEALVDSDGAGAAEEAVSELGGAAALVDGDGAGAADEGVSEVGGALLAGGEGAPELAGGAETSMELVTVP